MFDEGGAKGTHRGADGLHGYPLDGDAGQMGDAPGKPTRRPSDGKGTRTR